MNKLFIFCLVCAIIPTVFMASPPQNTQDRSYCALKLVTAARHSSDAQATQDMLTVIKECQRKGLSKQAQYINAHELAVSKKEHLAAWRLGTQAGKEEKKYTYHAQTALWTAASATAAVGTCWYTGLCGGKK